MSPLRIIGCSTLVLFLCGCNSFDSVETDILKVMQNQESCWNKGDIECFMEGYWNSDSLRFIGKDGIVYGWQSTLNRYKRTYPDRAAMGMLKFDIVSTEKLGDRTALVIGKWELKRTDETLGGWYTLIWKRIGDRWLIISDHTS